MALKRLDHYNVNPGDLDASRRFYTEVIGLRDGYRPPFEVTGAWLYLGDQAVVHLLVGPTTADGPPGRLDHIAFLATDAAEMIQRLRARGWPYWIRSSRRAGLHQVFVRDPDGIQVELSYSIDETLPPGDHPTEPDV